MKKTINILSLLCVIIFVSGCSEDKIELTGRGILVGKVVSQGDNTPLENARVSTSPNTSIVFTDENGNYQISDIEVGTYSVQAQKEGYLTKFESATINDDATINIVFELDVETANNDAPNAPTLVTPSNNTIDTDLIVELTWEGSDPEEDQLTYSVQLLNDQNSDVLQYSDLTDTTLTVSGLMYNTKYFWQVTATDGINNPVASTVFNFTTLEFPEHRVFFTRKINGNNVIFSSDESGNTLQLTSANTNSWRPRRASSVDKLAFLSNNGGQTHLFTMDLDGSNISQVTNAVAVNGFNLEEIDFEWKDNDTKLLFPNFDKLYEIEVSGTGLTQLYQTINGHFITEVDWNPASNKIALKTNDNSGYQVEIFTINLSGVVQDIVLQGVNGAAGGLDFSYDGTKLVYTYDLSANQNVDYRQFNSNMFIYDLTTTTATNISLTKPAGTNDLDPQFSPNEAQLIFVNTSNDGVSQRNIMTIDISDLSIRELFLEDGKMPDWK